MIHYPLVAFVYPVRILIKFVRCMLIVVLVSITKSMMLNFAASMEKLHVIASQRQWYITCFMDRRTKLQVYIYQSLVSLLSFHF